MFEFQSPIYLSELICFPFDIYASLWNIDGKSKILNLLNLPGYKIAQDICAINDALCQTHSPASSDHYFSLKVVLFCKILTDGQTTRAKIVITTGCDCDSVSWIKNMTVPNWGMVKRKILKDLLSFFFHIKIKNLLFSQLKCWKVSPTWLVKVFWLFWGSKCF